MEKYVLRIENGAMTFVYADPLAPLAALGRVVRASRVEPHPTRPGWIADMEPSGGPVLGEFDPYQTRAAALEAEREWLREHRGL